MVRQVVAASSNDGSEMHSIRLRVLGLTGIAVDAGAVEPAQLKHMRAVVAVTRDSARYGFSAPSRRLVKVPRYEHLIATWGKNQKNNNASCLPQHNDQSSAVIEFETAIGPRLRRSLNRNFELVIGVTASSCKQPTPIGAASLPLQQAVALRSRETGKLVLDLPVFNLASLKNDPFETTVSTTTTDNNDPSSSLSPKEKTGLFRSRSMLRQRSGTTSPSTTTTTNMGPSWPSPSEAVPNQCPLRMDTGRDAAILRIELEIQVSPTNVVLVQPQDDAIETAHSSITSERKGRAMKQQQGSQKYEPFSFSAQYHRVKIVDQTTMDCEIATVVARSFATEEEDESPPTLASSSGDLSSVEPHLLISHGAVERVLSAEDDRYNFTMGSELSSQALNDTFSSLRLAPLFDDLNISKIEHNNEALDDTIKAPRGGDLEKMIRKPSFISLIPRLLLSKTISRQTGDISELERCSSPSADDLSAKKQPVARIVGPAILRAASSSAVPYHQGFLHEEPSTHSMSSSELPVVTESRTAAPETFEPTPVHFSRTKPAETIQFALAMNMIDAPPPTKKKPENKDESIPMGTILQVTTEKTIPERPELQETGIASTMKREFTKHWRDMFNVEEEEDEDEPSGLVEEDEPSEPEDETLETRRPAFRDDLVDLVAAFGDLCRPLNTSVLDDSITDGPAWLDDDDQEIMADEGIVSSDEDDEESTFSENVFGELHHDEGTEIDASKALPLQQGYRLPIRKRSFVNFRRNMKEFETPDTSQSLLPPETESLDRNPQIPDTPLSMEPKPVSLDAKPQMIISSSHRHSPSTQHYSPHAPSTPPKKLKSLLRNSRITSPTPLLPLPEETSSDLNNEGSPNCVTQAPEPNSSTPIAAMLWQNPYQQIQQQVSVLASFSQTVVDFVAKAMIPEPSSSLSPKEEEVDEAVPVPTVVWHGHRDAMSVGDLTATSHEIQVDMTEFQTLIEQHLQQAQRDKKEYIHGNENMFDFTDDEEMEQIGSDDQEDIGSSEFES